MAQATNTANQLAFPRVPLARKRWRLSFGLTALFAAVTAVAVVARAAKMPAPLGVLFAVDALTFAMGLHLVRLGFSLYQASPSRPSDDRCASAHVGFGLLMIAVAGLTFGVAAITNR
jgi:hypothetical protein